ncbi:MAG: hypothetical protein JXJ04_26435 [Spirochaetales bacterium]|nr:hypothetical protein [Spirochaetales bacterium]
MLCKNHKNLFGYIPILIAFVMACLYFLFHLHFMQQFLDWDQVWYTNNIKNMLQGSVPYFNPHHIHYETGGKLFHEFMLHNFGDAGFTDVMFNNRLRSLVAACIAIFFIILYLKETTGRLLWGILGGLLVGFCHGFLAYSTQGDTPIFPASAFCAMLYVAGRIERSKHPLVWAFISGIVCATGVVFHQYTALACVAAVISIIIPPLLFKYKKRGSPFSIRHKTALSLFESNHGIRYKATLITALTGVILICAAYFYTGKTVFNLPFDKPDQKTAVGRYSYTTFQKWLFLYQDEGWWARGLIKFDIKQSFRGYTNAFLSPTTPYKYLRYVSTDFRYDVTHPASEKDFAYNQVAYFSLIPLAGIFIFFPLLWRRYKRGLVFLLGSFVFYCFFTTYWEPSYYEFWLIQCIISCVLAILFLNFIGEKVKPLLKRFNQIPFYIITIIFLIALSSHNVLYYSIPYSRYKHMEDIDYNWRRDYYWGLFSDSVYKFPDNPYKKVYTNKPVR